MTWAAPPRPGADEAAEPDLGGIDDGIALDDLAVDDETAGDEDDPAH